MRIVDFMKAAGMTIAVCQGSDISPQMQVNSFTVGGKEYRAGLCEVRNSISDHLQMFIEVLNVESVPIGEIEHYTLA